MNVLYKPIALLSVISLILASALTAASVSANSSAESSDSSHIPPGQLNRRGVSGIVVAVGASDFVVETKFGNVTIEQAAARTGDLFVRSRFHMMESRTDSTRHFAGSYVHHLKKTKHGHRIKLQRVDMVNAQGPYEYVLQAWV